MKKKSVLLTMLDWSQAFERQSHKLGINSFINNNVRISLIPTLISLFQGRKISVKWEKKVSKVIEVAGGGPRGGNSGILEYISGTKGNLDFLPEDEAYKFVDDASFLEILNLISIGLASLNVKNHVPSDVPPEMAFLSPKNFKTQSHLDKICKWTSDNEMLLKLKKSKYMIVNYCDSYQFKTRLTINNSLIEQVSQTRLLGVIIQEDLTWKQNTQNLGKRANSRMIILRKLKEFEVKIADMITIYILFIRSVIEQSSVVWSFAITAGEMAVLERTQKVALRIIFGQNYLTYENALKLANLPKIEDRYKTLQLRFALKCTKNENTRDMFPLAKNVKNTRNQDKFEVPMARKERFFKSAVPTMARMLNKACINTQEMNII